MHFSVWSMARKFFCSCKGAGPTASGLVEESGTGKLKYVRPSREVPEPLPAVIWQETGYSLDRLAFCHRANVKRQHSHLWAIYTHQVSVCLGSVSTWKKPTQAQGEKKNKKRIFLKNHMTQ